jgi:hypothetical protein
MVTYSRLLTVPPASASTVPILQFPLKTPTSNLDYWLDVQTRLQNVGSAFDSIASFTAIPSSADITVSTGAITGTIIRVDVAGGVIGTIYQIAFTITTTAGNTIGIDVYLPVQAEGSTGTIPPVAAVAGPTGLTGATGATGPGGTISNNIGTLTLGPGGSSGQQITGSGTGNFVLQLGGSSSLFVVKNNTGNILLTAGASTPVLTTFAPLQLRNGAQVWSGTSISTNASLFTNNSWTGTSGISTGNLALNLLQSTDGVLAGTNGTLVALNVTHSAATAGWTGTRQAGMFILNLTAQSGNLSGSYSALNTKANAVVSEGGTGVTPTTSAGFVYGLNTVSHTAPAATNYAQLVGYELNTWAEAGSSMMDKIGMQIVDITGSVVQGARDDQALSFNNQAVPNGVNGIGWKVLIGVGRLGGAAPLDPVNGWIMKCVPTGGTGNILGAGGIDFTQFVPTTAFIRSNNFLLDPSGNVTANTLKVGSNQVVGARNTGWTAMTGTLDKLSVYDTTTVTLAQLAGRVAQLQAALTTHGMIGA